MFFNLITGTIPSSARSKVFLYEDNWDDWFSFATRFVVWLVDGDGNQTYLGAVKIGKKGMGDGHRAGESDTPKCKRRPSIPVEFDVLPKSFFSLGQDDSYYQNLSKHHEFKNIILTGLRDIAFDLDILEQVSDEPVTGVSLLRSVTESTVRGQFHRLAHGGARLTPYEFLYAAPLIGNKIPSVNLSFNVVPESQPPSNVHVLIGRNGVGKTRLLHLMTRALIEESADEKDVGRFLTNPQEIADYQERLLVFEEEVVDQDESEFEDIFDDDEDFSEDGDDYDTNDDDEAEASLRYFANIVSVSFSAFDEFEPLPVKQNRLTGVKYDYIGLKHTTKDKEGKTRPPKSPQSLSRDFGKSVKICALGDRLDRWRHALEMLETDPIFRDAEVAELAKETNEEDLKIRASKLFKRLSSGHKIVLLTITRLVETVEERTLVLIDEPEAHLHPPLLSAFVRALSDLLINRNGVALIATHSPVILQEVPKSCVWKIRRSGLRVKAERPQIETFGENVGILTHEIFGLEVTHSGFHKLIQEKIDAESDYETVLNVFNRELGAEAKAIIRALIASRR